MAIIKCPHCATEHDTKEHRASGPDRIVKCRKCDFVFVTMEKMARIVRDEGGDGGEADSDEPRTAISSGIATPPPAPDGPGKILVLTATEGPDSGKVWRESKPLLFIGRRNADVLLADEEASRQHAVIEVHGQKFMLKDLGSTNGTYLDDSKVTQAEVRNQSRIRIGDTVLVVSIEDEGD